MVVFHVDFSSHVGSRHRIRGGVIDGVGGTLHRDNDVTRVTVAIVERVDEGHGLGDADDLGRGRVTGGNGVAGGIDGDERASVDDDTGGEGEVLKELTGAFSVVDGSGGGGHGGVQWMG